MDNIEVPLTQGLVAYVSPEDWTWIEQYKWTATKNRRTFYAIRYAGTINGKNKNIYMHREILGLRAGEQCDHIDGNGLNNCRDNLRRCTNSQNQSARRYVAGCSGYRGVLYRKNRQKWIVEIGSRGTRKQLGSFTSPVDAAKAYDREARHRYGEFAYLNFPEAEDD